jgi:hypothetical protein
LLSLSLHGEEENYSKGKSKVPPVDPSKKKKELLSDDTLISLMKIID